MIAIKKTQHILEYAGLRMLAGFVRLLPDTAAIALGRNLGAACAYLFPGRMKLAHDNLGLAYGDSLSPEGRTAIITSLLSMLGESLIESIIATDESVRVHVAVEGMEHLDRALARGKGAVILGPHFDMWELAGYVFGAHLATVSSVYKAMKNPYINSYLLRTREKSNQGLIQSKNALRGVMGRLKKGEAVVMLFDQNAGRSGLQVPFFGKTAQTYSAPAAFALKTGCAVIPAYMKRAAGFRNHRLIIREPFPLMRTGDMGKDLLANTRQYNDFIEEVVRSAPELWFGWLHRRWKLHGAGSRPAV